MADWTVLVESGRELARAFDLLDRAGEIASFGTAALITQQGLIDEARTAVAAAQRLLRR
jgi:hypothetical protein